MLKYCLETEKKLTRFWWPWPYVQGHHSTLQLKLCLCSPPWNNWWISAILYILKDFKNAPPAKMLIYCQNVIFNYVKIKLTSPFIKLAFNKKIETLWLMVAVTSRLFWDIQNLKSHRVPIPSIMSAKKFLNRCLFLKAQGKTKSNHEVLGLWKRSIRLGDVIIVFGVIGFLSSKD